MKKQILLVTAIILSFAAFALDGLCQGAAEYSMATGHAAAATAKAGSALSKATGRLAGRVAGKLSKSTERPRQDNREFRGPRGDQPVAAKSQPVESASALQISFSRTDATGKASAAAAPCTSSAEAGAAAGKAAEGSTAAQANPPCQPEAKYPSVVNLSFPKK
jgi:hypothetical protein